MIGVGGEDLKVLMVLSRARLKCHPLLPNSTIEPSHNSIGMKFKIFFIQSRVISCSFGLCSDLYFE